MTVHQSVLELIGRTPMVRAQRLDTGPCGLFLKLESANPGGSIKDRIGLSRAPRRMAASAQATSWSKAPPATPVWAWPWSRSRKATA